MSGYRSTYLETSQGDHVTVAGGCIQLDTHTQITDFLKGTLASVTQQVCVVDESSLKDGHVVISTARAGLHVQEVKPVRGQDDGYRKDVTDLISTTLPSGATTCHVQLLSWK